MSEFSNHPTGCPPEQINRIQSNHRKAYAILGMMQQLEPSDWRQLNPVILSLIQAHMSAVIETVTAEADRRAKLNLERQARERYAKTAYQTGV